MTLNSNIYSNDIITNEKKTSHNQANRYYRCYLHLNNIKMPLEFTEGQIGIAINRAKKYPEHFDFPIKTNIFKRWFSNLFNKKESSESRRGQTKVKES